MFFSFLTETVTGQSLRHLVMMVAMPQIVKDFIDHEAFHTTAWNEEELYSSRNIQDIVSKHGHWNMLPCAEKNLLCVHCSKLTAPWTISDGLWCQRLCMGSWHAGVFPRTCQNRSLWEADEGTRLRQVGWLEGGVLNVIVVPKFPAQSSWDD